MDLDEAIRYYSHLADECRRKANIERYDYMDLKDLAAEHGQLADWLNELKVLREKIRVLLEKQEQTKEAIPHRNYQYLSDYWCECGWHLGKKGDVKFCADCGRRIKWD